MNKKTLSVIISYLLIVVDVIVGIFFVPFLLNGLGDSEYGLYKLMFSTASYLSVLDFGIGATITRYVVKYKTEEKKQEEQNFVAMGFIIYLFLSFIVLFFALIVVLIIPSIYKASIPTDQIRYAQIMFFGMCISTAINLLNHAYTGLVSAYEEFVFSKSSNIIKLLLRVLLIVVGVTFWSSSAWIIVLVDVVLSILLLIVNAVFVRFKLKFKLKLYHWDKMIAKEAFVFTIAIFVQSVINQFNTNVDNVILGIFTTTEIVAMYSVAMQIYIMYSNLSTAISTIYFPIISKAVFNGESDDSVTKKVIEPSRMQLFVLLLALTGFCAFGIDFINLWVGPEYSYVYVITIVLLTASTLELSQNTITGILKAKNILHGQTIILAISTFINIIISCILVAKIGAIGAAIGTAFSMVFGYGIALNVYYQKKAKVNMKLYFKETFKGILLISIICLFIGITISKLIVCNNYLDFAIEIIIYIVIYCSLMFLFGLNKQEKRMIIKKLKKEK